jgi:hypothetical protein
MGDATLVGVCLGPPQSDSRGSIAKEQGKLTDKVLKQCINRGVTPVGGQFAGLCTGAADNAFAACAGARVACRFCQAANDADAIAPPQNCDMFDDGVVNASCSL